MNYSLNQEEYLKVFLTDGVFPIDDSASERALQNFTVERKNWVTINTGRGAQASAVIYSITETAKAINLNPFRYLEYVLTVMKDYWEDADYHFMEELLPWSEHLSEICRSKTKTTNV